MTSPAYVTIAGPASDDFTRSQHAVWASLPVSLTRAPTKARLVAVDGRSAGWLETLENAIRPGAAGVLVVRPAAGPAARDIRAVAAAAANAGTIVAVQTTWAANPAVAPFARTTAERLCDITLIDSVAQLDDTHGQWADVLLDHLSLLRAVIGPLELARFAAQYGHGYTVDGAIGARHRGDVGGHVRNAATGRPASRLRCHGRSPPDRAIRQHGDAGHRLVRRF